MPVSTSQFRDIFGALPTSVAIVTALNSDGHPRGFTCNALCAVSAASPQLLVCIDRASQTLPAIQSAQAFVVNMLAASGAHAAETFAGKGPNKFKDVVWEPSAVAGGAPVLTELAHAVLECTVVRMIEAGDHWIVIAAVEAGTVTPRDPLLYCRGDVRVWPRTLGRLAVSQPA